MSDWLFVYDPIKQWQMPGKKTDLVSIEQLSEPGDCVDNVQVAI